MPIWRTISYAYFPMRFHDREWIRNAPSWVFDDKYDLVAKVAPEDVNAWQILKQQQLAGIEVREAAERLRVTLETARFHLKRVLSKTGVRRQAELIRLMLLLPGC